jgi:hypothetical protein
MNANSLDRAVSLLVFLRLLFLPMVLTGQAGAHNSWLRQHPRQQGRGEDRILEERCR